MKEHQDEEIAITLHTLKEQHLILWHETKMGTDPSVRENKTNKAF